MKEICKLNLWYFTDYKETVLRKLGHFEHYKKYCESYSIIQNFPKAQK